MARATRGYGLLENLLARLRARKARALLGGVPRDGAILDIGCGSHPLFLLSVAYRTRTGIDRTAAAGRTIEDAAGPVRVFGADFNRAPALPFADASHAAVTMLAVFEHIEKAALPALLAEVRRVLEPGGVFVLTTPAAWSAGLLDVMARVGLVSADEIGEHQDAYRPGAVRAMLIDAGFAPACIDMGLFECGLNIWARARKTPQRTQGSQS